MHFCPAVPQNAFRLGEFASVRRNRKTLAEWRDLNGVLPYQHECSVNFAQKHALEAPPLEQAIQAVTHCPEIRKPFDVLAEGLVSEKESK